MKKLMLVILYCFSSVVSSAEEVEVSIPESFQLDVTYSDGKVNDGELLFGLAEIPSTVKARFIVDGLSLNGIIDKDDITLAEASFGNTNWAELKSFLLQLDVAGNVVSLTYEFVPPVVEGPIILNSPLTIKGVDDGNYFEYQYTEFEFVKTNTSSVRAILIDIKPGSFPNSINLSSNGATAVAVLGAVDFDVNNVDPYTLSLGSAGVKTVGKKNKTLCNISDTSGDFTSFQEGEPDGYDDLVCHFTTISIVPEEGDTQSTLKGELYDGTQFEGTDLVNIVP